MYDVDCRVPIDKMIDLLGQHFSPDHIEGPYSLSIVQVKRQSSQGCWSSPLLTTYAGCSLGSNSMDMQGQDGARLTHSHERQYNFALQSMTLWR